MNIDNNVPYANGTGGDLTYITNDGYKIHIFQNSGTFYATNAGQLDVLVVGGGGGGGVNSGGGGGGVVYVTGYSVIQSAIDVIVGNGGQRYPFPLATDGGLSSFSNIIASGGSFGVNYTNGGTSGSPQNITGYSVNYDNYNGAAGGGGASGITTMNTQNGIDGLPFNITGTTIYYGGGGGGAGCNIGYDGLGGAGGGGNGIYQPSFPIQSNIIDGQPNTGGGGGASGGAQSAYGSYTSGAGGSGIVIVRYPLVVTGYFNFTQSNNININVNNYSTLSNLPLIITSPITLNINPITTIQIDNNYYNIYQFTTNCNVYISSSTGYGLIDILVVGGGGSGSKNGIFNNPPGNGGGGGGVIYQHNYMINASSIGLGTMYNITVGSGANGQSIQNGGQSSFSNLIAFGGTGATITDGGTSGNGYYGGTYFVDIINGLPLPQQVIYRGSGGGGASSQGVSANIITSGLGGDGYYSDMSGTGTYYGCGGGGAGLRNSQNWITQNGGALGGSGNANNNAGGDSVNVAQTPTANSGGGGGGAGQHDNSTNNYGADGIIIIRTLAS
jgi:hypothetical protein